ncbi:MAG: nucleoside triphosphate pyrophosphohydrolase [Desulfobacterales bacterium]|nr:nucleoside triphosphate pyrophosphohydrolase [Desulfobacterales bacterium]
MAAAAMTSANDHLHLEEVLALIRRLRAPEGCPWDRKQTPSSLANYLIEEVHELAEAIASGDAEAVCEELGDVIFQVLFMVELYQEAGTFDMTAVTARNVKKMVRRHPHVFGERRNMSTDEIRANWHAIKQQEKGAEVDSGSLLDSVPKNLPALMRAYRISERAARAGFDWSTLGGVMAKVEEEWQEFKQARRDAGDGGDPQADAMEFGDILFTLTNVARFARFHPESALAASVNKFERRFRNMESHFARQGRDLASVDRAELEAAWLRAKAQVGRDG